jgi:hypothetical protein
MVPAFGTFSLSNGSERTLDLRAAAPGLEDE